MKSKLIKLLDGTFVTSKNSFCCSIILITFFASCKKFVDVSAPTTTISAANVYSNDATAAAVLTGIYTKISQYSNISSSGISTISFYAGLSADEFSLYSGVVNQAYARYYTNSLTQTQAGGEWWNIYQHIFTCNSAIEGLSVTTALTSQTKQQLLGEAKFMRAFFYSYLVSLYGDIPLILSTDYKSNSQVPRSPKSDVFKQIIADLKEAKNLLSEKYVAADIHTVTTERVRPTKWAAQALLARTYLYNAEWANAETEATALIGNSSTFSLSSLDGCFLKNSTEAIWQLQPVNLGANTEDARFFIIPATGFSGDNYPVYISSGLLNAFESTDQRKLKWLNKYTDATVTPQVDYYYPFKYKVNTYNAPVTEYLMVLRLAEQYLIRAEARARQGNVGGAQTDLNAIRHRAGLGDTPANDQNSLLDAILRERHVELFSEWGHRWFDLKRTGTIDAIMNIVTPQKGGTWNTNWQLYPLPLSEIQSNPNLKQNPSY